MNTKTLLYILCILPFFASAQEVKIEFFTTEDGLSGNHTNTVTQDDQGFIWFINDYKIHRYDGRNFLVYPAPPPEIPGSGERIQLLASYEDSLLFFIAEYHVLLLNPKTGEWQSFKPEDEHGTPYLFLFSYQLGPADIVLHCVKEKKDEPVSFWRFRNRKIEPVPIPESIKLDAQDFIWSVIDTHDHTYLFHEQTLHVIDSSGSYLSKISLKEICSNWIYASHGNLGPNNELIVMTDQYFFILDESRQTFNPHPANRFLLGDEFFFTRFIIEENGSIWAGGVEKLLIYYDAVEDTLYNFQQELDQLIPYPNDFYLIYKDNTGTIWVPSRMGLLKVTQQSSLFATYFTQATEDCNGTCSFRGISENDQGQIYAAFYNGIAVIEPEKNKGYIKHPFIRTPFGLQGEGANFWLNDGQLLDTQKDKVIEIPGAQNHENDEGILTKDQDGGIWWVHNWSLFHLDQLPTGKAWREVLSLPVEGTSWVDALHFGKKSGKLWISYSNQLFAYTPSTNDLIRYYTKNFKHPVSRVLAIEEASNGLLWLATDKGIVHFDPGKKTTKSFTVRDGLSNDFICGLLTEGDSCLWLSTNKGLSRFHIESETFINFYEEDGLTHNEFNRMSYYKAKDGQMFFGGIRGINAFYPKELMQTYSSKNKLAQLVLSAFEHVDERGDTIIREYHFTNTPQIQLHYWDRSFIFEYALTDYNNSSEISYSYQMEGYEDQWSAPSRFNFARYSSLPAGNYTFRVKARDSRGLWHPSELAVQVIVYPPWWATWWAYSLYLLLLMALGYAIFAFLKRRLILQNQLKLEQQEATRLKELDHFKSQLYTNLTHEFRTPLTVILGMTRQIREAPQKYLEEGTTLIENNGKNLLQLINQLLDLSKLDNKSFQLQLQQGDIIPYLRYVIESFQSYANGRNLSLRFFTPLESLVMDYDPEQIKQILTNLISNAVKFTPSGGEIDVKITTEEEALSILVKDTGIGIAAKDLPHVFDRFYQVDSSITRKGEGTGIGLAHAQELVRLMGGEILVESIPGEGSTFVVCLPIRRDAPNVSVSVETKTGLETNLNLTIFPAHENRTKETSVMPQLLIIEDNPDLVIYLKSCLGELYELDVAYNGKIGIEKALKNIPDLIISDLMMPEKDGYEVCDTLKNDDRTSHIPIVLLTAKADVASKIKGLKRGADAYLSKPFDKEELLVRLEQLVERQRKLVEHFSRPSAQEQLPDNSSPETAETIQVENVFMQRVLLIVETHYADENFALPQLCQEIGMSRSQLFRKMKALVDISPSHFIRKHRLDKAKILLETTDLNVSEVGWEVGYKDPSHFSKAFQEAFGMSPSNVPKD